MKECSRVSRSIAFMPPPYTSLPMTRRSTWFHLLGLIAAAVVLVWLLATFLLAQTQGVRLQHAYRPFETLNSKLESTWFDVDNIGCRRSLRQHHTDFNRSESASR